MDKVERESRAGVVASWTALVASFALSFATWVALAKLSGFNQEINALGYAVPLAIMMPLCVDGYVVAALAAWMAPVSDEVARFAKWNTYAAAGIGVVAQSTYHGLTVAATTDGQDWKAWTATVVGALPPLSAALSVHLRALVRRTAVSNVSVRTDTDIVALDNAAPVRTDTDTVPAVQPVLDTWTALSTDTDTDTLVVLAPPAPRSVRAVRDKAWKAVALDLIASGLTDREVAEKILATEPATWNTVEAGRKAISRLHR